MVDKKPMTLPRRKKKIDKNDVEAFSENAETVTQNDAVPRDKAQTALNTLRKKATAAQDKVIRDSFTMPSKDYALIEEIKLKLMKQGVLLNKGEILRAGLHALAAMKLSELTEISSTIDKVKVGRR